MPLPSIRKRHIIRAAAIAPLLLVVAIPGARQAIWHGVAPRAEAEASTARLEAVLEERKLYAVLPNGEAKTYRVAIGTAAYPTPTGTFTIRRIVWNPGWVPPASPWARGQRARGPRDPQNPMKVAKIFFKEPDYYIHGTGHVASLGTAASHGCLRMHPDEVAELGAALMEAGGVAHDWEWVKRTLRVGSTRTVNLKQPVRLTIRARPVVRDSVAPAPGAAVDSTRSGGTQPDSIPADSSAVPPSTDPPPEALAAATLSR